MGFARMTLPVLVAAIPVDLFRLKAGFGSGAAIIERSRQCNHGRPGGRKERRFDRLSKAVLARNSQFAPGSALEGVLPGPLSIGISPPLIWFEYV